VGTACCVNPFCSGCPAADPAVVAMVVTAADPAVDSNSRSSSSSSSSSSSRLGRCSPCNLSAMVVVIAADPAVDTGSVVAVWLQILQSTGLVVLLLVVEMVVAVGSIVADPAIDWHSCTCSHSCRGLQCHKSSCWLH
jgi:hypothetical protein